MNLNNYSNLKIGQVVRTALRSILESGIVSDEEIELLQKKSYSKKNFDIQYPLLVKTTQGSSPVRYYADPIFINGVKYYLCSEWYEGSSNNDRPLLMKWMSLHIINSNNKIKN